MSLLAPPSFSPSRRSLMVGGVTAVALGVVDAAAAPRSPHSVAALLEDMRAVRGASAHFLEEKHIALLKAPLVSEGDLFYLAPDKLARHVHTPHPSRLLVEGDTVRLREKGRTRTVSAGSSPVVAALVTSFTGLFQGDRAALEQHFRLSLAGTRSAWTLTLVPRTAAVQKVLRRVTFAGAARAIERLQVDETTGDRAVTTFSRVNTARTFSPAERRRVFSLG